MLLLALLAVAVVNWKVGAGIPPTHRPPPPQNVRYHGRAVRRYPFSDFPGGPLAGRSPLNGVGGENPAACAALIACLR